MRFNLLLMCCAILCSCSKNHGFPKEYVLSDDTSLHVEYFDASLDEVLTDLDMRLDEECQDNRQWFVDRTGAHCHDKLFTLSERNVSPQEIFKIMEREFDIVTMLEEGRVVLKAGNGEAPDLQVLPKDVYKMLCGSTNTLIASSVMPVFRYRDQSTNRVVVSDAGKMSLSNALREAELVKSHRYTSLFRDGITMSALDGIMFLDSSNVVASMIGDILTTSNSESFVSLKDGYGTSYSLLSNIVEAISLNSTTKQPTTSPNSDKDSGH